LVESAPAGRKVVESFWVTEFSFAWNEPRPAARMIHASRTSHLERRPVTMRERV
jgi:hypothetical protein